MHVTAKKIRRINKHYKKDIESKTAFRERCTISRRHDLPHCAYYECDSNMICSIITFLNKYKDWHSGSTGAKWRIYFKQRSEIIYADREFLKAWPTSKQHEHVFNHTRIRGNF